MMLHPGTFLQSKPYFQLLRPSCGPACFKMHPNFVLSATQPLAVLMQEKGMLKEIACRQFMASSALKIVLTAGPAQKECNACIHDVFR
eukprot:1159537-Pelagomonas_calceolata.AAC.5